MPVMHHLYIYMYVYNYVVVYVYSDVCVYVYVNVYDYVYVHSDVAVYGYVCIYVYSTVYGYVEVYVYRLCSTIWAMLYAGYIQGDLPGKHLAIDGVSYHVTFVTFVTFIAWKVLSSDPGNSPESHIGKNHCDFCDMCPLIARQGLVEHSATIASQMRHNIYPENPAISGHHTRR